ncbi:hypothetical protein A6R68_11092 [Neotoma lepida]|uniref:Cytochrome b-c1 complex subunit 7 n=1 Tax=Neotoma lepida TaxID=56216 RepID=A0A1A6FX82_NEOLE|nr:hypothetical protein A6R68_11092 [Neotoma lepida]
MVGRPAVAVSSKRLDGFLKWYYNAARLNKLGLMRDDTMYETEDILPMEQWTKYEEDKFYLEPYLKEVIQKTKENEEWAKK